mgnify:CR=1 FL=1
MSEQEKLDKLKSLFDSLESWGESAKTVGLDCEKMVASIHKSIGKEVTKINIAIKMAEIKALRNGGK